MALAGHPAGYSIGHVRSCWQTLPEMFRSSNRCDGAKGIFRYELLHPTFPNFILSSPFKQIGGTVLSALKEASVRIENKTASLYGFCYLKPKSLGEFSRCLSRDWLTREGFPQPGKYLSAGEGREEGRNEERGERWGAGGGGEAWGTGRGSREEKGVGRDPVSACGATEPREVAKEKVSTARRPGFAAQRLSGAWRMGETSPRRREWC